MSVVELTKSEQKLVAKLPKEVPLSERREFAKTPVYHGGPKPTDATANDLRMGITKCTVLARLELYRAQCLEAMLEDMEKAANKIPNERR